MSEVKNLNCGRHFYALQKYAIEIIYNNAQFRTLSFKLRVQRRLDLAPTRPKPRALRHQPRTELREGRLRFRRLRRLLLLFAFIQYGVPRRDQGGFGQNAEDRLQALSDRKFDHEQQAFKCQKVVKKLHRM